MTDPYAPTTWVDDSLAEPINAENLNKLEQAAKRGIDLGVNAVSLDAVGQAGGVMGLDDAGVGAQPPKSHAHTFPFTDETGVVHQVNGITYDGDVGATTFPGGIARINARSKNAKVWPVLPVSGADPAITNSTGLLTLASITQTIAPGAEFDFEEELWVSSTLASRGKAIINADAGAIFFMRFFAPAEYEQGSTPLLDDTTKPLVANNDGGLYADRLRMTPITSPTNGAQKFGGWRADGTRSYVPIFMKGYIKNPTSSPISMTSKVGSSVQFTDPVSVAVGPSYLFMAQR